VQMGEAAREVRRFSEGDFAAWFGMFRAKATARFGEVRFGCENGVKCAWGDLLVICSAEAQVSLLRGLEGDLVPAYVPSHDGLRMQVL
jgi:hypothetical protein